MIDSNLSAAFSRVEQRRRDVLNAFEPGFEPERSDVAGRPGAQPDPSNLCVVAPEGAYFVGDASGTGLSFTRAGSFAVADGQLRFAADGRPVLGFQFGKPGVVVPLRVDAYDAALGRAADPRVEADGTFAYTHTTVDPRSGERRAERVAVGRVALARFPAGTQPERVDATHVRAPVGTAPLLGVPADGRFAALQTHARDLGRVDVLAGLERMREAYDGLEALRAHVKSADSFDRTAMELLK